MNHKGWSGGVARQRCLLHPFCSLPGVGGVNRPLSPEVHLILHFSVFYCLGGAMERLAWSNTPPNLNSHLERNAHPYKGCVSPRASGSGVEQGREDESPLATPVITGLEGTTFQSRSFGQPEESTKATHFT